MADILWRIWQAKHIERRHGVSAQDFEEAWDDPGREELAEEEHPKWGPYYRSLGSTSDGRLVEMFWRWREDGTIWPITAYFKSPPRTPHRDRRPRRRRSP